METAFADPTLLALVLQENQSLKIRCRTLEERLDAAEEIISRLQTRSMEWEPPHCSDKEPPHHFNR
jgi:proteasome assembly chaperone (PAC2) family protein